MTDRVPLDKQLAALNMLVSAATMGKRFKPSELEYMLPRWQAAKESLLWLSQNERKIKEALSHGRDGTGKKD
jgi:hypothetical protein